MGESKKQAAPGQTQEEQSEIRRQREDGFANGLIPSYLIACAVGYIAGNLSAGPEWSVATGAALSIPWILLPALGVIVLKSDLIPLSEENTEEWFKGANIGAVTGALLGYPALLFLKRYSIYLHMNPSEFGVDAILWLVLGYVFFLAAFPCILLLCGLSVTDLVESIKKRRKVAANGEERKDNVPLQNS